MSKVAKSKEKPATKMEKPQNEPSSKTTKIKFEAILNVFFFKAGTVKFLQSPI